MNMPQFNSHLSIYRATGSYSMVSSGSSAKSAGLVQPAMPCRCKIDMVVCGPCSLVDGRYKKRCDVVRTIFQTPTCGWPTTESCNVLRAPDCIWGGTWIPCSERVIRSEWRYCRPEWGPPPEMGRERRIAEPDGLIPRAVVAG